MTRRVSPWIAPAGGLTLCSALILSLALSQGHAPPAATRARRDAATYLRAPSGRVVRALEDCAHPTQLHDLLLTQNPRLSDPEAPAWEKACWLRSWLFRVIPRAIPETCLDGPQVYGELMDVLRPVLEGRGGYYCGATAVALMRLYELFGLRAMTYNCGTPDAPESHVVTLVEATIGARSGLFLQDAYFNATLVDATGEPLPIGEMLRGLARDEELGRFSYGPELDKPFIFPSEAYAKRYARGNPGLSFKRLGKRPGGVVYSHRFRLDAFERSQELLDWIEDQCEVPDARYLFFFPISTSGHAPVEALADEARRLARSRGWGGSGG